VTLLSLTGGGAFTGTDDWCLTSELDMGEANNTFLVFGVVLMWWEVRLPDTDLRRFSFVSPGLRRLVSHIQD